MKLKDTENKTDDKSAVVPSTISFIGGFMTTAVTKIDVSDNALAAPMWKMADVGEKTDLVDITANRVEDGQEEVDKKVE